MVVSPFANVPIRAVLSDSLRSLISLFELLIALAAKDITELFLSEKVNDKLLALINDV